MKTYKGYCIDLDGTIYRGNAPIESAIRFVKRLTKEGIRPIFVTNNASKTPAMLVEKLTAMGLDVTEDQMMSSAIAAAAYIDLHYKHKKVAMIGEQGLYEALQNLEIPIVEQDADVFVMGIDRGISYQKLAEACLMIQNGAVFLSANPDVAFPEERGFVPGNGAFTKLLEVSSGKEATFIGKPYSPMLEIIQEKFGFEKEEMVMIGDNYNTDILAGIHFGIDTVHVNTGVSSTDDVLVQDLNPAYYLQNLDEWK